MARRPHRAAWTGPALPNSRHPETIDWTGPPYQRSGRWTGSIDYNGKKRAVGTFDTPRHWQIKAQELANELENARDSPDEPAVPTITEFVEWGWPDKFTERRQQKQVEHLKQQTRRFRTTYGDRPLWGDGEITLKEAREIADGLSRNKIVAIKSLYNDAARTHREVRNPFSAITVGRSRGRSGIKVLTEDEFELLCQTTLTICPAPAGRKLVAVLIWLRWTGTRIMEALTLATTDYSPRLNQADVITGSWKNHAPTGELPLRGETKTRQARRIAVPQLAVDAIEHAEMGQGTWVFENLQGNRWTYNAWQYHWHTIRSAFTGKLPADHWLHRRIAERATDKAANPHAPGGELDCHELRHMAATVMLEQPPLGMGLPISDVAYQMGHTEEELRRTYRHLCSAASRERVITAAAEYIALRASSQRPGHLRLVGE